MKLPPGSFDLNITPDKRTIFLHQESFLIESIRAKLNSLFESILQSKSINSSQDCISPSRTAPMADSIVFNNLTESDDLVDISKDSNTSTVSNISAVDKSNFPVVDRNRIISQAQKSSQPVTSALIGSFPQISHSPIEQIIEENQEQVGQQGIAESEFIDTAIIESQPFFSSSIDSSCELESCEEYYNRVEGYFDSSTTIESIHNMVTEPLSEIKRLDFTKMKVIGQFNMGFIIALLDDDKRHLLIIDQHAADEKFHYELYQKTTKLTTQPLIIPLQMEMSVSEELLLQEHLSVFVKNGFDLSFDPNALPCKRVKLKGVPHSKNTVFGPDGKLRLLCRYS